MRIEREGSLFYYKAGESISDAQLLPCQPASGTIKVGGGKQKCLIQTWNGSLIKADPEEVLVGYRLDKDDVYVDTNTHIVTDKDQFIAKILQKSDNTVTINNSESDIFTLEILDESKQNLYLS